MATVSRTFSVRNGLDVANTVVLDSNRNLTNIANVNATSFVTSAGLNVTDQANNAYAAANAAANTVRVSVNSAATLSGKQLNFVNTATSLITLTDSGDGNANIAITVVGGGAIGQAYDQANAAYAQANAAYGQANNAYDQANAAYNDANTRVLKAGDTMTGQLNISSGGLLVTGNVGFGTASPTSNLHVVGNANITTGILTSNITVTETTKSNNFVSSRTALDVPNLLNFNGERVRLYDFNQVGHPNYAIGVEPNYIWLGTDDNAGTTGVKFYGNTTQGTVILSNGTIQTTNTVEAKVIKANGTGTAIDASQGNVLTNQVTGTQFNFLNGLYTVSLNGGGSTSSYTLSLPANTGLAGQSLVTDGTGNLSWSSGASSDQANAAYAQANAAYGQANLAYNQANAAYGQANAAYSTANLKVASIAVSGNGLAVSNTTSANLNDYTISVNTASTTLRGTTLLIDDINSSDTGNAATANAVKTAWDYANTKLSTSGGTINGTLNVSGNLFVTGNTTFINVSTYAVDDSLIYLAANNTLTDVVDIGFVGAKNSGASVTHTGLARDAGDGTWYLFDDLADSGHQNNVIDFANSAYALLQANIYAQRLNVVTGFANIAVPLTVTGNTTLTANLVAQQNVNVTGTLNVAGLTEFTNNVALTIANVSTTLNVAGNTLLSTTNVNGALTITHTGEGLVVANANVTNKLTVGSLAITTNTITTSSTGQVVLDKFATSEFASAKYFVQANSGVDYTTTEVIVVQDGTNVWLTEYGTIQTGPSIGTFSADIDSGDVRLLFNANNNINTIRSIRYGVLPP